MAQHLHPRCGPHPTGPSAAPGISTGRSRGPLGREERQGLFRKGPVRQREPNTHWRPRSHQPPWSSGGRSVRPGPSHQKGSRTGCTSWGCMASPAPQEEEGLGPCPLHSAGALEGDPAPLSPSPTRTAPTRGPVGGRRADRRKQGERGDHARKPRAFPPASLRVQGGPPHPVTGLPGAARRLPGNAQTRSQRLQTWASPEGRARRQSTRAVWTGTPSLGPRPPARSAADWPQPPPGRSVGGWGPQTLRPEVVGVGLSHPLTRTLRRPDRTREGRGSQSCVQKAGREEDTARNLRVPSFLVPQMHRPQGTSGHSPLFPGTDSGEQRAVPQASREALPFRPGSRSPGSRPQLCSRLAPSMKWNEREARPSGSPAVPRGAAGAWVGPPGRSAGPSRGS